MRISTLNSFNSKVDNMNEQMESVATIREKILKNQSRLTPSEDPVATINSIESHKIVDKNKQFIKNINSLSNSMGRDEEYLTTISNIQNRMKELVINSSSGNRSSDDRHAYGEELDQLITTYTSTLNSRDVNGDYIFSGTNSKTVPIQKDKEGKWISTDIVGKRDVQISNGCWISANISISGVMNIGDNKKISFLNKMQDYQKTLMNNKKPNPNELIVLSEGTLHELENNFDNIQSVLTRLGGKQKTLELAKNSMEDINLMYQTNISKDDQADLPKLTSLAQMQTIAIQMSQKIFARVNQLNLFQQL